MNEKTMGARSSFKEAFGKLAAVLLAAALALLLTACTSDDEEDEAASDVGSYVAEETSIQELVIFEQDGLTLIASNLVTMDDMTYLVVTATNDTDQDLLLTVSDDFAVGDATSDILLTLDADAGETSDEFKMWFNDIATADELVDQDITGTITVSDAETYEELYDVDVEFTVSKSLLG